MADIVLQILFDNLPGAPGTRALWGFAALIEHGPAQARQRLLFDTGSNGRVLLNNMAALGVVPTGIDQLFLSHGHWDHIGGLDSILEFNPHMQCIVHAGFSRHLLQDLHDLGADCLVIDEQPLNFAPGLHSTGLITSEPPEHALVVETAQGAAVISGCAHPGMSALVAQANGFLSKPAHWAIGGFHLMYADEAAIETEIQTLRDLGISMVLATHCTGEAAIAAFARAFGTQAHPGGAGARLCLS